MSNSMVQLEVLSYVRFHFRNLTFIFIGKDIANNDVGQQMDLIGALFDAVVIGDDAVVAHVLRLGADINGAAEDGKTALHAAAMSPEGEQVVPYLISKGANVNARDNTGRSPLYVHSVQGRVYGVTCLLYNGADPSIRNNLDEAPLNAAHLHGHGEVVAVLLAFGAENTLIP